MLAWSHIIFVSLVLFFVHGFYFLYMIMYNSLLFCVYMCKPHVHPFIFLVAHAKQGKAFSQQCHLVKGTTEIFCHVRQRHEVDWYKMKECLVPILFFARHHKGMVQVTIYIQQLHR